MLKLLEEISGVHSRLHDLVSDQGSAAYTIVSKIKYNNFLENLPNVGLLIVTFSSYVLICALLHKNCTMIS